MNSAVNYSPAQFLPGNGDIIALKNGNGGYIGGVKGNEKLLIVPHCQGWEQFYFEMVDGSRFALKQKESGHYIGGASNHSEQPFLANNRDANEIFTYSLLPNGMVTILNSKYNKLSKSGGSLVWSNQTSLSESWNFELIQKSQSNTTSPTNTSNPAVSSSVNPTSVPAQNLIYIPPPGTVVAIENRAGGYLGGVKDKKDKIRFAGQIQGWEKFILESKDSGKVAFKQQVSGLYLGGQFTDQLNQKIGLAGSCGGCEKFDLVPRDFGWFTIKSEASTFLKKDGDHAVWTNVSNEQQEQWRVVPGDPNQKPYTIPQAQTANNQNSGQNTQFGQNQGQSGFNQGGFIPDFLKNMQQHMHQSSQQNQGNQGYNPTNQGFNPGFQGNQGYDQGNQGFNSGFPSNQGYDQGNQGFNSGFQGNQGYQGNNPFQGGYSG